MLMNLMQESKINLNILLILLIFISMSWSREFAVRLGTSYHNFSLKNIEEFQSLVALKLNQQGIPVKIVDKFPSYFGVEIQFLTKIKNNSYIGFYYGYLSTGGRIHYQDYSGEVKIDQVISGNSVGIYSQFAFYHHKVDLSIFSKFSMIFLHLKNQEYYQFLNQVEKLNSTFSGFLGGLTPGFKAEFSFGHFSFAGFISYRFTPETDLNRGEKANFLFLDNTINQIRVSWNGWSVGISLGIIFELDKIPLF